MSTPSTAQLQLVAPAARLAEPGTAWDPKVDTLGKVAVIVIDAECHRGLGHSYRLPTEEQLMGPGGENDRIEGVTFSLYAEPDRIGRRLRTNVGDAGETEGPDSGFYAYAARYWHIHLSRFAYWAEYSCVDIGDFQNIRSALLELAKWSRRLPRTMRTLLHLDDYFETSYKTLNQAYKEANCDKVLEWLALMRLGFYLYDTGRIAEMKKIRVQVANGLSSLLGPRHSLTLRARSDAVYALLFEGEVEKAHSLYVNIANDQKSITPNIELHNLFFTLLHQGQAEFLMGRNAEALETLVSALNGFRNTLGPKSYGFLATQLWIALVNASLGHLEQSLNTMKYVRKTREEQYGPDDSFAVTTCIFIGDLYRILRKKEDALANLGRGLRYRRPFEPTCQLLTLDPAINLVMAYRDFGMNDKAEALVDELNAYDKLEGEDYFVRLCQVKYFESLLLFDSGETNRAINLLQDLLNKTDRKQNNRTLLWVRLDLAFMLRYRRREGDDDAAVSLFHGIVTEARHASPGSEPDPPRLLEIAEKALRLVRAGNARGAKLFLGIEGLSWARDINTSNEDDLRYLHEIIERNPAVHRKLLIPGEKLQTYTYYKAWQRLDRGKYYVKIDDDIVWMADDAIPRIVMRKLQHPEDLVVSANIINNPPLGFMHYHMGALHPYFPEIDFPDYQEKAQTSWKPSQDPSWDGLANYTWPLDRPAPHQNHRWLRVEDENMMSQTPAAQLKYEVWGPSYESWAIAAQMHYSLLENIESDKLDLYKFDSWDMHGDRIRINFMCFYADDILDTEVEKWPRDRGDEDMVVLDLPKKLNRSITVEGTALGAHFQYWDQGGLSDTDLLSRYQWLADERAC
ncbi:mitochondrial-processing peptidase subunit alpha protein [Purpureocillium lavendulum]|uniref:Mitochondrial-processing peptidase subunit alpha protein n=1 Tax=Purpureocillium lavendulum TaxID=1247861 RepID=A0AB34FDG5_9HYPO|nr:mitochondrial-processing peptidase subunit alpha protein [Purpureocillium lavendulum]